MDDRLTPFYVQNEEFNANIRHTPILENEKDIVPYIGNGYFGLEIKEDAQMNIKLGRGLNMPVNFHPIVTLSTKNGENREATVVEYLSGIVHRFAICLILIKKIFCFYNFLSFFFLDFNVLKIHILYHINIMHIGICHLY